ncbi:hypothetical protein OG923_14440 [Streptomyces halstedii]|uniref:hypothetical protein n=1 Tax=Streptomyces halstedii TaxID=1944 RepID=UPI0032560FB8
MKAQRKIFVGSLALLAAAGLVGCSSGHEASPDRAAAAVVTYEADYPSYESIDDLIENADIVVKGTVVTTRVEELMPEVSQEQDPEINPQAGLEPDEGAQMQPVVETISTVRVSEVLSGDISPGGIIEVAQLRGTVGEITYKESKTETLVSGDSEYLFMLAAHGEGAPYDLLNPAQALYTVDGAEQVTAVGEDGFTDLGTVGELSERIERAAP